jgi:hypothetical protein
METKFTLRFPPSDIPRWTDRYDDSAEAAVGAIACAARARGFLDHAEFVQLGEWKSPRIRPRVAANDPTFVKAVTRTAFTTPDERLRIEVLTLLRGVAWPMASVILHWCHPDRYPILDYRALWSLGVDPLPAYYDFPFWWAYTEYCRELAGGAGLSMRKLDQALWQYSKEKQ